ncbi:hypothetical protein [Pyrococcus sp. NA2]|uniref:hypothetical protein n=1 Tax=Pyrococcus sp. (strain NA2) TaxID=342949 RepID=UPI000B173DDA|nr:hypothetical protein [Pyrococcus sp. NA2]
MEINQLQPKVENEVCLSGEEVLELVNKNIKEENVKGLYLKIFGKNEEDQYIIEMIVDKRRVLAVECTYVNRKEKKYGDEALKKLAELSDTPLIISVYPMDNQSLKLALARNIELYSKTPAIPLSEVFKREAKKTIEEAIVEAKEEKEEEIRETTKKLEEEVSKRVEIPEEIEITIGGDVEDEKMVKEAIQEYVKIVKEEINRQLKEAQLRSARITGEVGRGTISLNAEFYITAEEGNPEILKRRSLFIINKHVPKIRKITNLKPIIKDIKANVVIGETISTMEEKERGEVTLWRLTKPPTHELAKNLYLTVDPKFKQYFIGFARTLLKEIEEQGVSVDKLEVEILGGVREFEININLRGKSRDLDEPRLQAIITSLAKRHASELSKIVEKYVWVNNVRVELARPSGIELSSKATEILKRKEEIEKEVERMLKEAGIEELSYLLEDKKRELEKTLIRPKVEKVVQALRQRLQEELKMIPNVNLRWLQVKHDVQGNVVEVAVEASLAKLEGEGIFGALSRLSDEEVKRRAIERITKTIKEIGRENQIQIRLKRLNIAVK